MSHICDIELEIRDLDALDAACSSLGMKLVRDQKTYHCWGTGRTVDQLTRYQERTGKTLMPEGYTLDEMGKCEHAIHVVGKHGYEIGLVKRRDGRAGYHLFCDLSGQLAVPRCDLGRRMRRAEKDLLFCDNDA